VNPEKVRKFEGFFWTGIGAIICLFAWKSHFGSFREPGPGFTAFISGFFILGVGLIQALSQILSKIPRPDNSEFCLTFQNILWFRLVYTIVLLVGYALLLDTLGYILTTFLTMWGLFYERGKYRLASSFLASLLTVAVTYLVFEVWLHCQLPRGILAW
jgi:hypothetical protein